MKWMLDLKFEKPLTLIHHSDPILLMGSCFTGNIGGTLSNLFFQTTVNPCGIIFDPASLSRHVHRAISEEQVTSEELHFYNERFQSFQFHSDFSALNQEEALQKMNAALQQLRKGLKEAKHFIITLGSAFVYRYKNSEELVANCHQFPANDFDKVLLKADEIADILQSMLDKVLAYNPDIHVVFTVSPVRHVRDGVVANNRSKAQLIEAVHRLNESNVNCDYFPAYEWVMDVLRDYRWFDLDLVHPNYAATDSVFEQFCAIHLDDWTQSQLKELQQLRQAKMHKPRFPETEAHAKFLENLEIKQDELQLRMPWIKF